MQYYYTADQVAVDSVDYAPSITMFECTIHELTVKVTSKVEIL